MKVFAIGSFAKPITDEERQRIMRKEVPDTLKLYLEGRIEQFWFREDKPGVIFLMNTESLDQAKSIIHELPLAANGFLGFEFIPVGPLKPLGLLIRATEPWCLNLAGCERVFEWRQRLGRLRFHSDESQPATIGQCTHKLSCSGHCKRVKSSAKNGNPHEPRGDIHCLSLLQWHF